MSVDDRPPEAAILLERAVQGRSRRKRQPSLPATSELTTSADVAATEDVSWRTVSLPAAVDVAYDITQILTATQKGS
ncbi:hypothetical protein AWC11_21050 [Mycobacterium interjectum]|nr:hypothetical protein AWC11_21050 [Mycobacterium interjectum]